LLNSDARRPETKLQGAILANASYAIIATDLNGTVTHFNPAAERLLGYSSAEAVGKLALPTIHDRSEVTARARILSAELNVNRTRL
jgi:two-component system, sensor histidine kinase and response regulator